MFDYIARGHSRGWTVIVADPHGEECPHRHLQRLFELLPHGPLLMVAHSYGAPCSLGMLKAVPAAQKRLKALALTDGTPLPDIESARARELVWARPMRIHA